MKINLVPGPGFQGAKGSAKFRSRSGEEEFQVEVEARLLANSTLTVWVDDIAIGTITLDGFGKARLSLNRRLAQIVPSIVPGSLVGVTNHAGDIVVAGKF